MLPGHNDIGFTVVIELRGDTPFATVYDSENDSETDWETDSGRGSISVELAFELSFELSCLPSIRVKPCNLEPCNLFKLVKILWLEG